ncbi:flagellar basal body rod protein FlgB [Bacillus sp. L381]|uniref:Flagellar basal body rod protein FlgB n=2 Tax=Bacillus amyloliquefaciens TaxID=1390 RepID=A0A9P1JH33_BACAS|nr:MULTISPECIES: flagellar basal body rod protein FlgB [Bacillus]AEB63317.1 flagellar component of cell-proximal portion of basal-body rod [Bacillus amyloliquefaciens LL3]ARW38894.1 Flagellar basal body rod protein FlgB [Bacillus amyloliquefaciens]ASF28816.1 flagellar basal body rod protein FlgB [Bacillus amyloliquefaciens]AZV89144.1 flagellar basal body rod protein FlgB [Bacillus amyloliquefaciens]MBW8278121.1 flagellar basal body rod protein FlgB [Bacillus amyloliquefaciens]
MDLFSGTIQNLENALGRADIKQKVITNNIANIDTPNYKAKKVSFRNLLDQETSNLEAVKTDYRHVDFTDSGADYSIVSSGDTSYQQNGNNVDIDKEMTDLAENQINYQALVERMSGKFNSLKTVLTGGK